MGIRSRFGRATRELGKHGNQSTTGGVSTSANLGNGLCSFETLPS